MTHIFVYCDWISTVLSNGVRERLANGERERELDVSVLLQIQTTTTTTNNKSILTLCHHHLANKPAAAFGEIDFSLSYS